MSKSKHVGPLCPRLRMVHHPSHLVILANVNCVGWGMFSAFYERNSKVHNDLEELKEGTSMHQSNTAGEKRNPGEKDMPHTALSPAD